MKDSSHARGKKHVTLVSVCKALRDDGLFSGGRSSLGKLLSRMGFGHKKITKGEYINILFYYAPLPAAP